jgi:hypothetical protein
VLVTRGVVSAFDDGLAGDVDWRNSAYLYLFAEEGFALLGSFLRELPLGLAEVRGDYPSAALLGQVLFFFDLALYLQ